MSFNMIPFDEEEMLMAMPSLSWFNHSLQFIETIRIIPYSVCLDKQEEEQPQQDTKTEVLDFCMPKIAESVDSAESKPRKTCNCSKTHCLKRYCECFNAGQPCTP